MYAHRSFACASALVSMLIAPAAFGQCVLDPCPDLIVEGRSHWLSYGTALDTEDTDGNGIIDHWEVRLFNAVLCDAGHAFHEASVCTLLDNLTVWDAESIAPGFVEIRIWAAASASVSTSLRAANQSEIAALVGQPGHVYATTYASVLDGGVEAFAATGDVDGDGFTNLQEATHVAAMGGDYSDYVAAALDPLVNGSECTVTLESCPDLIGQVRLTTSLYFGTPDDIHDEDGSGLLDSWELLLFQAALCDSSLPINHDLVCLFHRNRTRWASELAAISFGLNTVDGQAALLTMNTAMRDYFVAHVNSLGDPLEHTYGAFEAAAAEPFAADGDFDGDGVTNAQEAANVKSVGGGAQDYVAAAMDPLLDGSECTGFDEPCPDFNAQGTELYSVIFTLDWEIDDLTYDGIPDSWQAAVFADALCSPDTPLDDEAACAFRRNRVALRQETGVYNYLQPYEDVIALFLTMSSSTRDALIFRYAMTGTYEVVTTDGAKASNEPFAADGDLDGDGYSNLAEYQNSLGAGLTLADFVTASQQPLLNGSTNSAALPLGRWSAVTMVVALALAQVFKRGEWEMRV